MASKLVVLYGHPEDTAAFDRYYVDSHVPKAQAIPGVRRYDHGHITAGVEPAQAPFYYIAELYFDDAEAITSGLATEQGQAAAGDLPNFATGGATLMIADA